MEIANADDSSTSGENSSASAQPKRRRTYKDPVPFLYSEGDREDAVLAWSIEEKLKNIADDDDGEQVAQAITLGVACRLGHVALTEQLLRAGHGSFPDDRNWWPIHEAAFGLHIECCKLLIEIGNVDVNAKAHDGVTPLLMVCRRGTDENDGLEVAKLLIQNGADPNLSSLDCMTPLIQAIRSKNRRVIDFLLDNGADPHLKWYNGWSTLHEAANSHDEVTMKRLLEMGVNVHDVDDDKHTALFVAVQEGYLPCVNLILQAAGDRATELCNKRLADGCSCVMVAGGEGFDEILSVLISYGADVNATMQPVWGAPGEGVHVLAATVQKNNWRCLRLLLPHVDREVLARTEVDPMSAAALRGAEECVRLLLDAGYSTEVFTESPTSAIIIRYLQLILTRDFYTPLREAVRKGHRNIVEMLITAGAKMLYASQCSSPFLYSFRNRLDPSIMRCFLEHDVDLNFRSAETVCTVPDALLAALGTQNRKKLFQLLKCGLNPSLKHWCACSNKTGYSLLHDVRQSSYVNDVGELVKLLCAFSPIIPGCCSGIADTAGCLPAQVGSLSHLCRLAIRKAFPPSLLIDDKWLKLFPYIPPAQKRYLSFDSFPVELDFVRSSSP